MTAATGRRAVRVAERIKAELAALFARGVVRDPSAADACVTGVQVSDDLSHARVYVRLLRADVSEQARAGAVAALNRAAGFLRRELATVLELRHQPELRFFWDEDLDRATRIDALLSEIEREGTRR